MVTLKQLEKRKDDLKTELSSIEKEIKEIKSQNFIVCVHCHKAFILKTLDIYYSEHFKTYAYSEEYYRHNYRWFCADCGKTNKFDYEDNLDLLYLAKSVTCYEKN